jgi:methyltransferase OMS1
VQYLVSYGDNVSEIALTDSTENMVPVMRKKIDALNFKGKSLTKSDISTEVCSAEDLSKFETESFDSVVDTFGLCSYEHPDKALKEMRRVCRKGGKLLLLEHGRGYYSFLNSHLDDTAESHALSWGCVWNKDIENILLGAGFQQKSISRYHFGTTFYVVETNE